MAFIANTAFEARLTNNMYDQTANIAGLYQSSSTNADCSAGLLCVRNGKVPNQAFDTGSGTRVYNENTWIMNAATDAATMDDVIYACDPHDWPLAATPNGNLYAVGHETLGLGAPAGRFTNFCRINFDGQSIYRFGVGNLSASLSTNTYFTIDDGMLVPAASAPATAGSIYFTLEGQGTFVAGNGASFGYVDVIGHKVSVSA
jgi:hypothetical protein